MGAPEVASDNIFGKMKMFTATYRLKEIGTFETLAEAFKVIYEALKKDLPVTWQIVETTIWIKEDGNPVPYLFYDVRDLMCQAGYLVNGKWVDKPKAENVHD